MQVDGTSPDIGVVAVLGAHDCAAWTRLGVFLLKPPRHVGIGKAVGEGAAAARARVVVRIATLHWKLGTAEVVLFEITVPLDDLFAVLTPGGAIGAHFRDVK